MNTNTNTEMVNILRVEGIMAQGYGLNPKIVMRDKRLTPEAKCIYSYFASFAGNGSQAFPSRDVILDELQMSKDRYYRHLKLLLNADYIRIEQLRDEGGFFKRNIYTIVTNPNPATDISDNEEKVTVPKNGQRNEKTAGKSKLIFIKPRKKQSSNAKKENVISAIEKPMQEQCCKESLAELRSRLQIDDLKKTIPEYANLIEEIYLAAEDMALSEQISIGGAVKNKEAIQNLLNHLTSENIRLVTNTLASNKKSLTNRKKYIQACLSNSMFDINKQNDETKAYLQQWKNEEEKELLKKEREADESRKLKEIYIKYPKLESIDCQLVELLKERARGIIKKSQMEVERVNRKLKELEEQRKNIIIANSLSINPSFLTSV